MIFWADAAAGVVIQSSVSSRFPSTGGCFESNTRESEYGVVLGHERLASFVVAYIVLHSLCKDQIVSLFNVVLSKKEQGVDLTLIQLIEQILHTLRMLCWYRSRPRGISYTSPVRIIGFGYRSQSQQAKQMCSRFDDMDEWDSK